MQERRTPIWPLEAGLEAMNALGKPLKTVLGRRAFMPYTHALNLQAQGKVRLLVGLRPETLTIPVKPAALVEPAAPVKRPRGRPRKSYLRSDMQAED